MSWALRGSAVLFAAMMLVIVAAVAMFSSQNCGTGSPSSPTAPPEGTQTEGQVVRYLESQGFSSFGAAGIVGNLEQESTLNPADSGGGLAQWNPSWYGEMSAWATGHGLTPTSMAGQLEYLVSDLHSSYPKLVAELNSATSPQQAATMFETTYELCSGYLAYMVVAPGSLCMDGNRRQYALEALNAAGGRSTTVLASYVTGGVMCAAAAEVGSGNDPIPSPPWTIERDDMGVDASAPTGTPIYAIAASTLAQVIGDWFEGEPLLLFKFDTPQTGTPYGDQYWYLAEQIIPVTTTIGTTFATGQAVAHYAPAGTGIEIGWGSPTSDQRTLAGQEGDTAAANPGAGQTTQWGETFKRYFGIKPLGVSP